jgi:hypothetical protein
MFDLLTCVSDDCYACLLSIDFYCGDSPEPTIVCVTKLCVEYVQSFRILVVVRRVILFYVQYSTRASLSVLGTPLPNAAIGLAGEWQV